jgi:hypothetical protein
MVLNPLTPPQKPGTVWLYLLRILITVAVMVAMGSFAGMAYFNWQSYLHVTSQQQVQQQAQLDWDRLDHAETAAKTGDYLTCSDVLSQVSSESAYYRRAQQLQNECDGVAFQRNRPLGEDLLLQAENLAKQGELKKAIHTAIVIERGPLYATAQQQIKIWSGRVIDLASDRYRQPKNQVEAALNMLQAIPRGSPLYETAQTLLAEWQQERADNDYCVKAANQALTKLDLVQAEQFAQSISPHAAWASQRQQIRLEIQSIEHSFDRLVAQAEQYLAADQFALAAETARKLPDIAPWQQKKQEILSEVRMARSNPSWLPVAFSVVVTLFLRAFLKPLFVKQ